MKNTSRERIATAQMATIPTDHFFCTRQICSAEVRKINAPLSQTYQSGTTQKTILNKNSMIAKINKLFAKYLRSVYKELHADRETGC